MTRVANVADEQLQPLSYLPAGWLEVDGASSVGHCAFHPHEEISLCTQLFAFFTKAAACKTQTHRWGVYVCVGGIKRTLLMQDNEQMV